MNTIDWGPIQESKALIEGCTVFHCAHHGGIIVAPQLMESSPYFEKLKPLDLSKFKLANGNYAFEQDCDSSVILAVLPREILQSHYDHCETQEGYIEFHNSCLEILKHFHPEILSAIAV